MDYIYEEGTFEREQEEGVYDLAFRNENFSRIRERLTRDDLINEEESIVLERVQSILIALMLDTANAIDILDRLMEYTHELAKTREEKE